MPESFMNCKCGFWLAFVLPVVVLCSGGLAASPQKSCYRQLVGGGGRDGFTFESDPKKPSVPIVVTLGPGTAYREEMQIQPLEPSVLRMNLSHVGTDPKRWGDANNILRTVWPFGSAILADNPGPKIRITNSQSIVLHTGISLTINREGTSPFEENTRDLRNLSMSIQEFDWMTENLEVGSPIVLGDDVEGIVTHLKPNGSFTVKITSLPKIGRMPVVFEGVPSLRLIQAIRILDWGLPLLVVAENNKGTAGERDQEHSGREFLQRVLKFYPFVSIVSAKPPLSSEEEFAAIIEGQGWGGDGDEFILVREKNDEGQQQQVAPVLVRIN